MSTLPDVRSNMVALPKSIQGNQQALQNRPIVYSELVEKMNKSGPVRSGKYWRRQEFICRHQGGDIPVGAV